MSQSINEALTEIEDRVRKGADPNQAFALGEVYESVCAVRRRLVKTVEPRHIAAALKRVEREGKPVTLAAFLERIEQEAAKKR